MIKYQCSLPNTFRLQQVMFFSYISFQFDTSAYPGFEGCCNRHDKCYDTCNKQREGCDKDFQECLKDACHLDTIKEKHSRKKLKECEGKILEILLCEFVYFLKLKHHGSRGLCQNILDEENELFIYLHAAIFFIIFRHYTTGCKVRNLKEIFSPFFIEYKDFEGQVIRLLFTLQKVSTLNLDCIVCSPRNCRHDVCWYVRAWMWVVFRSTTKRVSL